MRLPSTLAAAFGFALLLAPSAGAQQHPAHPSCGSMKDANENLDAFAGYFRDAQYAAVRKSTVRQLQPGEPQSVVTNVGTCRSVLNAALRMLRQYEPTWPQVEQHGYDFTVFQYGPYYAILITYDHDPNVPGGSPPYLPLLIFQAEGLKYLMAVLT